MKWKITTDVVKDRDYLSWVVDAHSIEDAAQIGRGCMLGAGITEPDRFEVTLFEEDKQRICDKLLLALQLTRHLCGLEDLRYEDDMVIATYRDGYTKLISVECDSGIAMINDILKRLMR